VKPSHGRWYAFDGDDRSFTSDEEMRVALEVIAARMHEQDADDHAFGAWSDHRAQAAKFLGLDWKDVKGLWAKEAVA
jgi:hypothetical protein